MPSFIIIGISFIVDKENRMRIYLLLCCYLMILILSLYLFDSLLDRNLKGQRDINILFCEAEPERVNIDEILEYPHSGQQKLLEFEELSSQQEKSF